MQTNLRNWGAAATMWDWTFLNDCFGETRIRVSDIDGHVERHGRFLYIETKGTGQELTTGQERSFRNRIRDGLSTYLIVWGPTDKVKKIKVLQKGKDDILHDHADNSLLRTLVLKWFEWANKQAGVAYPAPPPPVIPAGETEGSGSGRDAHHVLPIQYPVPAAMPEVLYVPDPAAYWQEYRNNQRGNK